MLTALFWSYCSRQSPPAGEQAATGPFPTSVMEMESGWDKPPGPVQNIVCKRADDVNPMAFAISAERRDAASCGITTEVLNMPMPCRGIWILGQAAQKMGVTVTPNITTEGRPSAVEKARSGEDSIRRDLVKLHPSLSMKLISVCFPWTASKTAWCRWTHKRRQNADGTEPPRSRSEAL